MTDISILAMTCRTCGKTPGGSPDFRRLRCPSCTPVTVTAYKPERIPLAGYLRVPGTDPDASDRYLPLPVPPAEPSPSDVAAHDWAMSTAKVLMDELFTARSRYGRAASAELAQAHTGPDPAEAATVPEFIDATRQLIVWAGDPPLRELQDRAGIGRLPKSTLHDALNRSDRLPKLAVVTELVRVCGAEAALPAWIEAWKRLRAATVADRRARRRTRDLALACTGPSL